MKTARDTATVEQTADAWRSTKRLVDDYMTKAVKIETTLINLSNDYKELEKMSEDLFIIAPVRSGRLRSAGLGNGQIEKSFRLHMVKLGRQDFKYFAYDPAFPDYGDPKQADLVCCLNVLEHVEPPYLNAVLQELRKTVKTICLITIQFGPSLKSCPIVQNSHLIQKPTSWWIPKLCEYFEIVELESTEKGFWVVLEPHSK